VAAPLRAAAVLSVLLALVMPRQLVAQDADASPLTVPDLTVTAEDPLILLPPLGPAVNQAPLAVPPAARMRAAFPAVPAVTGPGFGLPPPPDAVLRIARSAQAVERSSEFAASAAIVLGDRIDAPHAVPAALSYRTGGSVPTVDLGLSGLLPVKAGVTGDAAAHAAVQSPSVRGRIGGALTFAGEVRAGQAVLDLGAGSLSGTVAVLSWQAHLADAQWRTTLAADLALPVAPAGPQVDLGVAAWWSATGLSALPSLRLHYAAPPAWHLAAGVRPMLGYPSWLRSLVHDRQDSNLALRPEQGWLTWLGGGIGGVEVRAGWAHGLTTGGSDEHAARTSAADLVLVGAAAEGTWNTVTGPATVAARAGANWDRDMVHLRLRADGQWQIVTRPAISLLLAGRWIGSRHYHGVYRDEDWALDMFQDEPGSAVIGGFRWSPAWGHRLDLVGGVNFLPTGDLTWGAGIEYGGGLVRLTAPP
jgi:hypothetical protein